jgi:hypothetical protein
LKATSIELSPGITYNGNVFITYTMGDKRMKNALLEKMREELNKLVEPKEAILTEGEILKLSRELDKVICKSYKNNKEC